jgi:plastocyanin
MRRYLWGGLLLLLLAGCRGRERPREPVHIPPEANSGTRVLAVQDKPKPVSELVQGRTGVIRLVMTDSGFQPAVVHAELGHRVKIYLRNEGARTHNLVIPRFHIATSTMAPGAENYIEFTANEKGRWPFFSDAPGQQEPGLVGTLIVE